MKKFVGFICSALLMITMSMTVCAGGSPSVSADNVNGTDGTASATTSPTTGEPITLMVAGAAVVIGAAGVVVTSKKRA